MDGLASRERPIGTHLVVRAHVIVAVRRNTCRRHVLIGRHHWQLHGRQVVHVAVVRGRAVVLWGGVPGGLSVRRGVPGRGRRPLHARVVAHNVAHRGRRDGGRGPDGAGGGIHARVVLDAGRGWGRRGDVHRAD